MEEYIPFPDHLKDIFVILKLRNRCWCIFGAFVLVKPLQPIDFHKHSQIQGTTDLVNIVVFDLEFFFQNFQKTFIHFFFCFQADHFSPLPFFQLFLDFYQKIFCLIFVNTQICISHNSVRMCTDNIITQEKFANIPFNNLLQKNHCTLFFSGSRNFHDSWQYGRNLNCCKFQFFCMFLVIFLCNKSTDVQCLITDQGEWSGRIHCHRCQHRIYIILKIAVHKLCLFFRQFLMFCHQMKSCFFQHRKYRSVESIILYTHQFMSLCTDFFQLLFRSHTCNIFFLITCMNLVFQRSHTYHKKFIQIGRCDT